MQICCSKITHVKFTKGGILQKSFPAKNLLKQTTYLLLEAKIPSCFNYVSANNTHTHTIGVTKQLNKCLTVHIKPFPKEP